MPAWKAEGQAGKDQQSPDLASLISEIVSGSDWQPGSTIVLLLEGEAAHSITAFKANETGAAKLIVDADELELISDRDREPLPYRVRLHFGLPRDCTEGTREFIVKIGDRAQRIELNATTRRTELATFDHVMLPHRLDIAFEAIQGQPVISGIELIRLADNHQGEGQ